MKLLLIVAALVLLALLALWVGQRALVYFPSRSVPAPEDCGLTGVEQARFTADDGVKLRGWFVPASGTSRDLAVLVCNGNGGNVANRSHLLHHLPTLGLSVLVFDWRGYGESDDVQPTEDGLYRDGRAALAWLSARTGLPADRIVLFGESLGTGVAVELAAEAADAAAAARTAGGAPAAVGGEVGGTSGGAASAAVPYAVVLQSPFTSLPDAAAAIYPWLPVRVLLRDRYDSLGKIGRVKVPLLVVHGALDVIVPVEQGRALAAAAGGSHQFIELPRADHNDVWRDGRARRAEIAAFLDGLR